MVLPLVRKYLPAPPGMAEQEFYSCLSCNAARIDASAWDGAAFAADLEERVIKPGRHALDVMSATSYATRLFTTISPAEMTEDPTFTIVPARRSSNGDTLYEPPVSSSLSATIDRNCAGDQAVQVPGWPDLAMSAAAPSTSMPFALRIESHDLPGEAATVKDNTTLIRERIATLNDAVGYPHPDPGGASSNDGFQCGFALGGTRAHAGHVIGIFLALSLVRRIARRRSAS
jgi:hypothetical protein